jgi:hypothetical protein
MQPRDHDIRNLALYAPRIAYGMIVGVPRVPFVVDVPIQFTSSAVDAPPIVANFDNNLVSDTIIDDVQFTLFQQNSFPGSPFQSLYFSQLKQQTGVKITLDVYGGPKYATADTPVDLANFFNVYARLWPAGWPLYKQSNVKISAVLSQTPVSVPFDVNIQFNGFQFLDKVMDDLSDEDARCRLRELGFETPDLKKLLVRAP